MANYTTNLKLEKPLQSESYNIDVHNRNSDKIDKAFIDYKNTLQKHKDANPMDHPNGSVKLKHMSANSVGQEQIINNAITDEKIGDRRVGMQQGAITGSLTYQLNEMAKMFNALKGMPPYDTWNRPPFTSLSKLESALKEKQEKGNYAHLDETGKVRKEELPEVSTVEMREY